MKATLKKDPNFDIDLKKCLSNSSTHFAYTRTDQPDSLPIGTTETGEEVTLENGVGYTITYHEEDTDLHFTLVEITRNGVNLMEWVRTENIDFY